MDSRPLPCTAKRRSRANHDGTVHRGLPTRKKIAKPLDLNRLSETGEPEGGEGGIRTHGALACTLVFETSTIGHSVTSPACWVVGRIILRNCGCFQTVARPLVVRSGLGFGLFHGPGSAAIGVEERIAKKPLHYSAFWSRVLGGSAPLEGVAVLAG
jgi:hypothetical protein